MYSNKNQIKSNKKYVLLTILFLALVALTIVWFLFFRNEPEPVNSANNADSSSEINLEPPTEQELQAGDSIKERQPSVNEEEQPSAETPDSTIQKQTTEVVITDASQYGDTIEIRAFMPEIFERGICTVTMTNGNDNFTVDEAAYPDASSTICINQKIKVSDLPKKGDWKVIISFESDNYRGSSDERVVTAL